MHLSSLQNTGTLDDLACRLVTLWKIKYLLRYYGQSMPFGNASFSLENIGFLSAEQALADYATLIDSLKKSLNAEKCPLIAFGKLIISYFGMAF